MTPVMSFMMALLGWLFQLIAEQGWVSPMIVFVSIFFLVDTGKVITGHGKEVVANLRTIPNGLALVWLEMESDFDNDIGPTLQDMMTFPAFLIRCVLSCYSFLTRLILGSISLLFQFLAFCWRLVDEEITQRFDLFMEVGLESRSQEGPPSVLISQELGIWKKIVKGKKAVIRQYKQDKFLLCSYLNEFRQIAISLQADNAAKNKQISSLDQSYTLQEEAFNGVIDEVEAKDTRIACLESADTQKSQEITRLRQTIDARNTELNSAREQRDKAQAEVSRLTTANVILQLRLDVANYNHANEIKKAKQQHVQEVNERPLHPAEGVVTKAEASKTGSDNTGPPTSVDYVRPPVSSKPVSSPGPITSPNPVTIPDYAISQEPDTCPKTVASPEPVAEHEPVLEHEPDIKGGASADENSTLGTQAKVFHRLRPALKARKKKVRFDLDIPSPAPTTSTTPLSSSLLPAPSPRLVITPPSPLSLLQDSITSAQNPLFPALLPPLESLEPKARKDLKLSCDQAGSVTSFNDSSSQATVGPSSDADEAALIMEWYATDERLATTTVSPAEADKDDGSMDVDADAATPQPLSEHNQSAVDDMDCGGSDDEILGDWQAAEVSPMNQTPMTCAAPIMSPYMVASPPPMYLPGLFTSTPTPVPNVSASPHTIAGPSVPVYHHTYGTGKGGADLSKQLKEILGDEEQKKEEKNEEKKDKGGSSEVAAQPSKTFRRPRQPKSNDEACLVMSRRNKQQPRKEGSTPTPDNTLRTQIPDSTPPRARSRLLSLDAGFQYMNENAKRGEEASRMDTSEG